MFPKMNTIEISGFISDAKVLNGNYGQYGNLTIACDDGYYKKGENGQDDIFVERTHFVEVKFNANFLKKLKGNMPEKGQPLGIKGKVVQDSWTDKTTNQKRSALKVEAKDVLYHFTKPEYEALKQMRGANQQQQGNNAPQQNGGYNQSQPQQNGGGYNQHPQQHGQPQPNGGGYNQAQQHRQPQPNGGGFQQPMQHSQSVQHGHAPNGYQN